MILARKNFTLYGDGSYGRMTTTYGILKKHENSDSRLAGLFDKSLPKKDRLEIWRGLRDRVLTNPRTLPMSARDPRLGNPESKFKKAIKTIKDGRKTDPYYQDLFNTLQYSGLKGLTDKLDSDYDRLFENLKPGERWNTGYSLRNGDAILTRQIFMDNPNRPKGIRHSFFEGKMQGNVEPEGITDYLSNRDKKSLAGVTGLSALYGLTALHRKLRDRKKKAKEEKDSSE